MKKGYCSFCDVEFEYFTLRNFIIHAPCKQCVEVEPCEPEVIEEPQSEVAEDGTNI